MCGSALFLHDHHIVFGTANRKQSEKYGLKVWLCAKHHTGADGVHFDSELNKHLKKLAQAKYEAVYGNREDFIEVFGKSYL